MFSSPLWAILGKAYNVVAGIAFLWAPVLLVWMAAKLWLAYVQKYFILKNFEFVLLEIKMPRTIQKTPLAMELVLQALYQGGTGNWYERWWEGKVKPWFSLELVSLEGNVRFFIRTPAKFKKIIESHIYAQYPDIEVHEVQDYVSLAPYIHEKDAWTLWGCEFGLTKPDPYPIKTYVDYGLDSPNLKEEQKSDPLTSLIEFLGSLGRGQQVWIQVLVQATGERFRTPGTWLKRHDWKHEGKRIIKELQEQYGEDGKRMTQRQSDIIMAIEKSLGKLGFDCGIRALYIAQQEHFDSANIAGITGAFRQFSSQDLNGFKPVRTTGFDYPWQDFRDIRLNALKREIFDAYVRRSYFYPPYKRKPFVLNTEELATIYHFPGGVVETPTFERIESRKGEPPPNIPV